MYDTLQSYRSARLVLAYQRHKAEKNGKTGMTLCLCLSDPLSLKLLAEADSRLLGLQEILEMNDLVLFSRGVPGELDF